MNVVNSDLRNQSDKNTRKSKHFLTRLTKTINYACTYVSAPEAINYTCEWSCINQLNGGYNDLIIFIWHLPSI